MRKLLHVSQFVVVTLVAAPLFSRAADDPLNTGDPIADIARSYNQKAEPLLEQLDKLTKQSKQPGLSLDETYKLIDQGSALRKQVGDIYSASQSAIDAQFKKTRSDINDYNSRNQGLGYSTAIVGSQIDLFNNVAKYPKKGDFDSNKDQMSQSWDKNYGSRLKPFGDDFAKRKDDLFKQVKDAYGIDLNATGYNRVGTSNPYTNQAYYKYYDENGNLRAGQWKNDAAAWTKWQDSVEASRRRQLDQKPQLENQSTGLTKVQDQLGSASQAASSRVDALTKALNDKQRELKPQPGITMKDGIRYKNGYPISPDHLKIPGYTGPRWVDGSLVSP